MAETRAVGVAGLFAVSPDRSNRVRMSPHMPLSDFDVTELRAVD